MEEIPEEDRKLLEDEKKKQLNAVRLRAENISIVDIECGPETQGYWYMDIGARYQVKRL